MKSLIVLLFLMMGCGSSLTISIVQLEKLNKVCETNGGIATYAKLDTGLFPVGFEGEQVRYIEATCADGKHITICAHSNRHVNGGCQNP